MSEPYTLERWRDIDRCEFETAFEDRLRATINHLFTRLAEVERERDEARAELGRIKRALPEQAATVEAWETLRRERDEARAEVERLTKLVGVWYTHARARGLCPSNYGPGDPFYPEGEIMGRGLTSKMQEKLDERDAEVERLTRERDEAEKKLENAYVLIEELKTALSDVIEMREDSDPWPQTPEDQMERAEANEEIWQEARATLKKVKRHWKS